MKSHVENPTPQNRLGTKHKLAEVLRHFAQLSPKTADVHSSARSGFLLMALLAMLFLGGGKVESQISVHLAKLEELQISAEFRCSDYVRSDYSYSQSVEDRIISNYGGLYSPYDNLWYLDKFQTDIEHIVATSEAHDSGLCGAPKSQKQSFASDIDNLTLASPYINRYEKIDKDAAEWIPARNSCWFVGKIIDVKTKYSLSVDQSEYNALKNVLLTCANVDMQITTSSDPVPVSNSTSTDIAVSANYNFKNCTELRQVFPSGVQRGHSAYQSKFDRDNDGHACE